MARSNSGSNIFKNRSFIIGVLVLIALLVVGLVSVAGVTLWNKLTGATAPPISTPTSTAAAIAPTLAPTMPPTPTFSPVPPTVRPSATFSPPPTATQPMPSATTGAEATATTPPQATATSTPGAGEMPNTGGGMWELVMAGGGLAGVLALARGGRRRKR